MDILAHYLWTFAFYFKHPKRVIAGVIGFMPDILTFGPFFVVNVINGSLVRGRPELASIPTYVFALYDLTHSIVVCICCLALLYWLKRDWFWISFGWPLHILIDLFTHTEEFFPTPIFWPLSNFHVSLLAWATGWFMLLNYGMLVVLYAVLIARYGIVLKPKRSPKA